MTRTTDIASAASKRRHPRQLGRMHQGAMVDSGVHAGQVYSLAGSASPKKTYVK
jgi:hypothetical protein